MTIRAVLRHGVIEPIEPLPQGWADGQELLVEEPHPASANEEIHPMGTGTRHRDGSSTGSGA